MPCRRSGSTHRQAPAAAYVPVSPGCPLAGIHRKTRAGSANSRIARVCREELSPPAAPASVLVPTASLALAAHLRAALMAVGMSGRCVKGEERTEPLTASAAGKALIKRAGAAEQNRTAIVRLGSGQSAIDLPRLMSCRFPGRSKGGLPRPPLRPRRPVQTYPLHSTGQSSRSAVPLQFRPARNIMQKDSTMQTIQTEKIFIFFGPPFARQPPFPSPGVLQVVKLRRDLRAVPLELRQIPQGRPARQLRVFPQALLTGQLDNETLFSCQLSVTPGRKPASASPTKLEHQSFCKG